MKQSLMLTNILSTQKWKKPIKRIVSKVDLEQMSGGRA